MDYSFAFRFCQAENTFADIKEGDWYADAVLKLAAAGVMEGDGVNSIVVKGTIGGTDRYEKYTVAKEVTIQGDKSGGTVYGSFIIADHATLTINGTVEGTVKGVEKGGKLVIGENGTYSNLTEGTYIWTVHEDGSGSGWVKEAARVES